MTARLPGNRIQAHRGASATCPENTMAAFRAAHAAGAKSIETDLTLLADGVFCLHHDRDLGRTVKGSGRITDLDSSSVRALDAGTWHNSGHDGEPVPLLGDALAFQHETGIIFNWEIKDQGSVAIGDLARAVMTALQQADPALTLVSSFSLPLLEALHAAGFHHKLALIAEETPEGWAETGRRLGLEGFHLDADFLDSKAITAMQESGFATRIYTVNDAETFTRCAGLGIDTIITDKPEEFIA
ncbi:MAG: glycerophosphodiester phosphodiesterase family protein [Candidatus Puniceispirillales bacterium]